jgi:uncharacterized protein YutE (UPF0331/DUF86 family)
LKIERAGRYKDKLNLVSKRVELAQGWLQQISAEEFLEDDKTRLASYKAFQEAVEACLDLVAMMCKDSKMVPKDDYGNLETLGELSKDARILLMEANGLRNHLVHRYNRMDDVLTLGNMKILLPGIAAFPAEVAAWIEKRF